MMASKRIKPLTASIMVIIYLVTSSLLLHRRTREMSVQQYLESANRVDKGELSTSGTQDARPTGLRLVLIGDSITRHQYLSLAYFLRYGKWFDPRVTPNLVNQNDFKKVAATKNDGWATFFRETNKILSPYERCDCFREKWRDVTQVDSHVIENRYFYDPERNNSLTYLLGFGNTISGLHGRVSPEDAFRDINSTEYQHIDSPSEWRYADWGMALEEYVAPLAATHVLMNAGYWPHDFDTNEQSRDSIVKAFKKTGHVGIWRTNSYLYDHSIRPLAEHADEAMKGLFDKVLDISWTYELDDRMYWDDKHFNEPVYRVMNEELLEMIGHTFPLEYEKQELEPLTRGHFAKDPLATKKEKRKKRKKK
jgi:hypothetical protein